MQDSQPQPSRRRFFAGAATAGAAAAAVAALPHIAASDATAVTEPVPVPPERGGGYRLSAHVQQYYKTTQL